MDTARSNVKTSGPSNDAATRTGAEADVAARFRRPMKGIVGMTMGMVRKKIEDRG
jgi:hypothetical protein